MNPLSIEKLQICDGIWLRGFQMLFIFVMTKAQACLIARWLSMIGNCRFRPEWPQCTNQKSETKKAKAKKWNQSVVRCRMDRTSFLFLLDLKGLLALQDPLCPRLNFSLLLLLTYLDHHCLMIQPGAALGPGPPTPPGHQDSSHQQQKAPPGGAPWFPWLEAALLVARGQLGFDLSSIWATLPLLQMSPTSSKLGLRFPGARFLQMFVCLFPCLFVFFACLFDSQMT